MPPVCNNSRTCRQFGPVPCVVGYNATLCIEDPEAYTHLDQPLADARDVVLFGDNPYPTLDEVSTFLLFGDSFVNLWFLDQPPYFDCSFKRSKQWGSMG